METRLRETYNRLNFIVRYKKKKNADIRGKRTISKVRALGSISSIENALLRTGWMIWESRLRGLDPYNGWIMATTEIGRVDVTKC